MDGAPCVEFLRYIFETYNVVFIGYSIRDADIKNVIASTNKKKEHFWVEGWSRKRQDELLIRGTTLKETYNVQLVPYCIDNQGVEIPHGFIESLEKAMLLRG